MAEAAGDWDAAMARYAGLLEGNAANAAALKRKRARAEIFRGAGRGDAAGRDVDIPRRRVAAPPRPQRG